MGMWRAGVRVLALRVRACRYGRGQAWACVLCGDGRAGVC